MSLTRLLASARLSLVSVVVILLFGTTPNAEAQDAREAWTDLMPADAPVLDRVAAPTAYRAVALDFDMIAGHLSAAPVEEMPGRVDHGVLIVLPLPDGEFATYRVVESSVMEPGLQARYPSIRTYIGHEVDSRRSTVRLSVSPQGFHAMGFRPEGTFYIDPLVRHDVGHAMSYWRSALPPRDPHLHPVDEVVLTDDGFGLDVLQNRGDVRFANGAILRTYRIAIAGTFDYTSFHSTDEPNVEEALAAMVVTMNRVSGVYERDLAVRMVIVENNDEIIYTSSADDPYPPGITGATLNINQSNLNNVIGTANYDIGHVFTTGGGGLAGLAVVCTGFKAWGATGLSSPIGDTFDVDYVSHEIGHQFGANHTFNAGGSPCGGNRNGSTAYEPGSGSTIMSYSGLCGDQNIQNFSNDYFHNASLTEMLSFVTSGDGSTCPEETETGNAIPVPVVPTVQQIPILTPLMLPGGAEYDGDYEDLTFVWEGMDLGPAGPPPGHAAWNHTAPFFRTFNPSDNPDRFLPRLDFLITGTTTLGEGLPNSNRTLRFRLTVRNNAPGGGSVQDALIQTNVVAAAGPFEVTSQSDPDVVWTGGTEQVVTWNVAGTATSAMGGENVDILLSRNRHIDMIDGTYIVLAEGVPNNGAATIVVPVGFEESLARVFVRASEGFFFSFNTEDITLTPGSTSGEQEPDRPVASMSAVYPNPLGMAGGLGTVNLSVAQGQSVQVAVYDALGRRVMQVYDGPMSSGVNHQFEFSARDLAAGTYFVRAAGERFNEVRLMTVVH